MHFTKHNINVPDELLQYHEEGKVVFFCGAGVSVNAGLPTFYGLTKKVVKKLSMGKDVESLMKLELYEQIFHQIYLNTHINREQIYQVIKEILEPNLKAKDALTLHKCILGLGANDKGQLRAVTTNFDLLFDETLEAENIEKRYYENYEAPALPIPEEEWDGIVYLHGKMNEKGKDNLVLSSSDFGKAYLKNGWAAKFTTELFQNNVVCFVGYSANDPVMRYMLDAFSVEQEKYPIFAIDSYESTKTTKKTKDIVETSWKDKGVKPILYEVKRKKHSQLIDLMKEWLNHYQRRNNGKDFIDEFVNNADSYMQRENDIKKFLWVLSDPKNDYENMKYFSEIKPCPSWKLMNCFEKTVFDVGMLKRFGVDDSIFKEQDKLKRKEQKLKFSLVDFPLPSHVANWSISTGIYNMHNEGTIGLLNHYFSNWVLKHLNNLETFGWVCNNWQKNNIFKDNLDHRLSQLSKFGGQPLSKLKKGLKKELKDAPYSLPNKKMRRLWHLFVDDHIIKKNFSFWEEYVVFEDIKDLEIIKSKINQQLSPKISVSETGVRLSIGTVNRNNSPFIENIQVPMYQLFDTFNSLLYSLVRVMDDVDSYEHYMINSITDHEQNSYMRGYFEIIRGVRDSWVDLVNFDIMKAQTCAYSWFYHGNSLLKRLALFAATYENVISSNTAIEWLKKIYEADIYVCKREELRLLDALSKRNLSNKQWKELQKIIFEFYQNKVNKNSEHEDSYGWHTILRFHRITGGNFERLTENKVIEFCSAKKSDYENSDFSLEEHEFYAYSRTGWVNKNEIAVSYPKKPEDILKMLIDNNVDPNKFSDKHYNHDIYRKYKRGWEVYIENYGFQHSISVIEYIIQHGSQYYIAMLAILLQSFDHKNLNSRGGREEEAKNIAEKLIRIFPSFDSIVHQIDFLDNYCRFVRYESRHYGNEEFVLQSVQALYPFIINSEKIDDDEPVMRALNSSVGQLISALINYVDHHNEDQNNDEYEIPQSAKVIIEKVLENPMQSEAWGSIGQGLYNLHIYDEEWTENTVGRIMKENNNQKVIILQSVLWWQTLSPSFAGFIFPFLKEEIVNGGENIQDVLENAYRWVTWLSDWCVTKLDMKVNKKDLEAVYKYSKPIGIYYIVHDLYRDLAKKNESGQQEKLIRDVIVPIWDSFIPREVEILNSPEHNVMKELYQICLLDNTKEGELIERIAHHLSKIASQYISIREIAYDIEDNIHSENHARNILKVVGIYKEHNGKTHEDRDIKKILDNIRKKYPDIFN